MFVFSYFILLTCTFPSLLLQRPAHPTSLFSFKREYFQQTVSNLLVDDYFSKHHPRRKGFACYCILRVSSLLLSPPAADEHLSILNLFFAAGEIENVSF